MSLSRLDNFLKNVRGNIIYVNPNDLDSTDSIENQGNSLTRPFKTIQRALIEASRFSYQAGVNNDRFNKTTILLYPGDHVLDNRPGWIPYSPTGSDLAYKSRDGVSGRQLAAYNPTSNFDLETLDNDLYPLNSIYGGVIIPRGVSLVGMDLRKTVVRPKYVPNPENDNIEKSCLFRVTGGCYFWQFTMLDADPNGVCFKDYTFNRFVPNFSHHKLSCFEFADGVNAVDISDEFMTFSTTRTDLDMYYEKISDVYDQGSGRPITPDFPAAGVDIELRHMLWDFLTKQNQNGKTILLTTHYIEEAEMLCDQVAIIDNGKVITQGTPKELTSKQGDSGITIELSETDIDIKPHLKKFSFSHIDGRIHFTTHDPEMDLPEIINILTKIGCHIHRVETTKSSLEDVFLKLTGKGINE